MSIKNLGLKINHNGRPKGCKNRLNWSFLTALAADFEEHGPGTIRICRIERPHEYLKIVAGLMPREFTFEDNRLADVGDEELDAVIEYTRQRLADRAKRELIVDVASRETKTVN